MSASLSMRKFIGLHDGPRTAGSENAGVAMDLPGFRVAEALGSLYSDVKQAGKEAVPLVGDSVTELLKARLCGGFHEST